jgi:putative hemolysin
MDTSILFEVAVILALILANGVFAAAEMALVASRKGRLVRKAKAGDRRAGAALALIESRGAFLSTVQVGITLIGTLASAFGGASIAASLSGQLARLTWLRPYAPAVGLGLVVLLITYLSLVLGELAPKRMALQNPERLSLALARPMRLLCRALGPINKLLSASTNLVLALSGQRQQRRADLTADDIADLVRRGVEVGVLEDREEQILTHVLRLDVREARNLMTPRTEMVALETGQSLAEALTVIRETGLSRIPIYKETPDQIVGVLYARDLVGLEPDTARPLKDLLHPVLAVPERTSALRLLATFQRSRRHLALVIDEYGGTAGIVTLEDVLEEIVGEIVEEHERIEEDIVEREDGSLLVDGGVDIVDLRERLGMGPLPGEKEAAFETLAGFVLTMLDHLPRTGEYFDYGGYRFEVVDMDGLRVDRVLVAYLQAEEEEPATD